MAYVHDYEWISRNYGVPARRNAPVRFKGRKGKVTATSEGYIRIKFDDEKRGKAGRVFHPTWKIEWLEQPALHATGAMEASE